MDKLITHISAGVGKPRKKKKRKILVRLGSKRSSDDLLPSDDDTSDEDYVPEIKKARPITKSGTAKSTEKSRNSKVNDTRNQRKKKFKGIASVRNNVKANVKKQSKDVTDLTINEDAWTNRIPPEMLLYIFQIAVAGNEHRLTLLIRMSTVCKLWRQLTLDPTLWHHLDLTYGWIKSPLKAIMSLHQHGRLVQLQQLNVSGSVKVNNAFIKYVADEFPQLKSLNISSCSNVKTEGLLTIADKLKELKHINASNINRSGTLSAPLNSIIQCRHESLEKFEMLGNHWTNSAIFNTISTLSMLTLLDISLVNIPVSVDIIKMLMPIAGHLQVLRMSRCTIAVPQNYTKVQADMREQLSKEMISLPNLIELSAAETEHLNIKFFINNTPRLKYLDLRGWMSSNLTHLSTSTSLTKLRYLNLRKVSYIKNSEFDLSQLAGSLEELDVSWMKDCPDSAFNTLIDALKSSAKNLKALHCAGMQLNMNQLRSILRNCDELQTIDLESCRGIDRGLKRLHGGLAISVLRKQVLHN